MQFLDFWWLSTNVGFGNKKNVFYGRLASRKCLMEFTCPDEVYRQNLLIYQNYCYWDSGAQTWPNMIKYHNFWTFLENRNEIKLKEVLKYLRWYIFLNVTFSKLNLNFQSLISKFNFNFKPFWTFSRFKVQIKSGVHYVCHLLT